MENNDAITAETKRLYDDLIIAARRLIVYANIPEGDMVKGAFKVKDDGANWVVVVGLESNLIPVKAVEES